jgi:molybdopterin-guanine dinucleotide biosynthesis protein A
MEGQAPSDVSGFVLAGGKSSRMGQDKALLELAGKPLVLLAVEKLQRVCAEVYVLGNRPELEVYAPLVRDLHEGCGPLGGIEAALLHSVKEWNLFMAVDMPFLPAGFLDGWVRRVIRQKSARVAMFTVEGRPQPALCLLHQEVAPYVRDAVEKGEFKLLQVLEAAAKELAVRQGMGLEVVFLNLPWGEEGALLGDEGRGWAPTAVQRVARHLWFANLNTPEEFAAAEAFSGELEK